MLTESATDAKNKFGAVMEAALREPVVIQRAGRNSVVMLAYADFEELMALADHYWGKRAKKAKENGMVGAAKSQKFLDSLVNAQD